MFAGLAYGGGAAPLPIQDPGPIARYGLPVAKLVVNLGAAGMIGALVLAVWALSPKRREFDLALDVAAASAAVLTVASAATGIFTFLVVTGEPLVLRRRRSARSSASSSRRSSSARRGSRPPSSPPPSRCCASRCATTRRSCSSRCSPSPSLVPMAQQGHAAGAAGHNAAIASLGLHLVFAAVWLGGLLTIVLLRRELDARPAADRARAVLVGRAHLLHRRGRSRATRTPRSASARGTSSAPPTACSCS